MATRVREKAAKRHENRDKRPHATARYVRINARKVKLVIDLIREARGDGAAIVGIFHDDVAREAVADRTIPVRRP